MKKSWLKDCNRFEYPYHANWWRNIFTKISLTKPQNQLLVIMIGCNDKRKWWQREGCYDKVILCARRESSPIHFLNTSFSPSLPIFPLQDGTFLQRSCDKPFTFIQIWCDKNYKLLVDVREIWESSTLINTFPLDCKQQGDGDYLQQMVENGRREIKYPDSWRI